MSAFSAFSVDSVALWCNFKKLHHRGHRGLRAIRRRFGSCGRYLSEEEFLVNSVAPRTMCAAQSIRQVAGQAKATLARFDYDPYGGPTYHDGASATRTYTGHDLDPVTGMYFAPFRYYAPGLARWGVRDPLGMVDGPNLYIMTSCDPLNRLDSLGLDWLDNLASFSAGFGDALTLNLTCHAREWMGTSDFVDPNSWWYTGGEFTGAAVGITLGAKMPLPRSGSLGRFKFKFDFHGPHHAFPSRGPVRIKYPHWQLNWWRQGVRDSGHVFRIPKGPEVMIFPTLAAGAELPKAPC